MLVVVCLMLAGGCSPESRALGLIKDLKVEDEDVRVRAKDSLADIGRRAVGSLVDALRDEDPRVRGGAAEVLGRIKSKNALDPLIIALSDEDGRVRISAARALGEIKDPRAVPALNAALSDDDMRVQGTAQWALEEIKGSNP